MCIFHKWKKIFQESGSAEFGSSIFADSNVEGVAVIEKCSKCNKERAYFESINGSKTKISVAALKQKML